MSTTTRHQDPWDGFTPSRIAFVHNILKWGPFPEKSTRYQRRCVAFHLLIGHKYSDSDPITGTGFLDWPVWLSAEVGIETEELDYLSLEDIFDWLTDRISEESNIRAKKLEKQSEEWWTMLSRADKEFWVNKYSIGTRSLPDSIPDTPQTVIHVPVRVSGNPDIPSDTEEQAEDTDVEPLQLGEGGQSA
ncbi:hypothetical protein MMC25_006704 [Agyrium rufum]|nr:hypothetical protein [Agyrium rufum]